METRYLNTDMCKFDHHKKKKAEPSRLIPRTLTTNIELLTIVTLNALPKCTVPKNMLFHANYF